VKLRHQFFGVKQILERGVKKDLLFEAKQVQIF
jgi:hypothetical protein